VISAVSFAHSDRRASASVGQCRSKAGQMSPPPVAASAASPPRARVVKGTFQSEVTSRAVGATNRVVAILGKDTASDRAVRDALTGGRATPEVAAKAQRIRKILDEHRAYLRASGLDVGERRNYFPRQYDEHAIAADPNGFRAAVAGEYQAAGLSASDANDAARAFFEAATGIASRTGFADLSLSTSNVKGRTLPPSADQALEKWLVTDPREALARYFNRTTRLAEFTRRFGKNGELADEWFARMARQGWRRMTSPRCARILRAPPGPWACRA
jgi:hypothetical protein